MRIPFLICVTQAVVAAALAQNPSNPMPDLPKEAREMLVAAAPFYNFNEPAMKPWHLKGTYQLYDDLGNLGQQGTYEYWWVSPKVYRSSWTRTGAARTEWHTADGMTVYQATGDRLFFFEHELERLLFSPLPDATKLDVASVELEKDRLEAGKIKLPCAVVKARMRPDGKSPVVPGTPAGSYCFDPSAPVLRIERLFNSTFVAFDHLVKTQNRILTREIAITDGRRKLMTFTVDATSDLLAEDAALTPPVDAKPLAVQDLPSSSAHGLLAKEAYPVYPLAAKMSHVSGTVILDAMIGKDGRVNDIRVLASPSPLLTSAAKEAVVQWQYSPYLIGGQLQEVNTIINVIFSLGY
jgi:TonB family protein